MPSNRSFVHHGPLNLGHQNLFDHFGQGADVRLSRNPFAFEMTGEFLCIGELRVSPVVIVILLMLMLSPVIIIIRCMSLLLPRWN